MPLLTDKLGPIKMLETEHPSWFAVLKAIDYFSVLVLPVK
jgi:hypothetical protein